jgi:hypothetical protein
VAAGRATGSCSRGQAQTTAGSQADTGRPDTAVVPDAAVDSGRLPRPGPPPTGRPRRGHRPAVRTASPGGSSSGSTPTPWQCPHAVAGAHCRSRRVCMDARAPGGRGVPALLRAAAVSAVDHDRPGRHPAVPRTLRGVRFRVRSAQPTDVDGPDARTLDAAGRHTGSRRRPALRTPATAGSVVQTYGNATLDSRQHNPPPPPPMSDQERDRKVRQRPAPAMA